MRAPVTGSCARVLAMLPVAFVCSGCHHSLQAMSRVAPQATPLRTSPVKVRATLSATPSGDPSLVPSVLGESHWSIERYRIVADLDFDGVDDLMLSHSISQFGNAGGFFEIYRGNSNGTFASLGSISAHPLAVSLTRRDENGGTLTTYHHDSARSGALIRHIVTAKGVIKLDQRDIYPGDNGTPEGRAEYARVFNNADRLRSEISTTRDGAITWKRYGR